MRSATRVALIGQTTAENLFEADENPVGKTIRIRQTPFTIIGTLAPKGQNLDGRDQDDDFFIRNLAAAADTAAETTRVMSLLLGAIASVSLLVGGIGIMNIMLVSVTERTREIGIRRAIGARQKDILAQFLLEAIMISITGCLIGLLLGIGGALLVNAITDMVIVISGASVLVAFAVAAGVGVFFGFYPARKAAALDPIEALRYQ